MSLPPPSCVLASPARPAELDRALLRDGIFQRVLRLEKGPAFDFKEILTQTRFVRAAGRQLWRLVRPFAPEVLIGPGFGGSPLLFATAIAAAEEDGADPAIWMVRDRRKAYYGKRWVEGPRLPGTPRAVILDDFLGHGSAVELIDEALAAESMQAQFCAIAVLYDAWSPRGSRQLSVGRCPVVSVFKRHDIGLTRDAHDARPPHMQGSAPAPVDKPAWWCFGLNTDSSYALKSAPVIADGAVFAADDQSRVSRFCGTSGALQWRTDSIERPAKGIVQRLQHVDSSLVYGCYDGTLTRLRAIDGRVEWRRRLGVAVHATPSVDSAAGRVFVNVETFDSTGPGGYLAALDWATGKMLWRYAHAFWAPGTPAHDVATGSVVAACNDESLACVDAGTGELRWRAITDGLVRGEPAIDGGRVFVATESGHLQSFDLASGLALNTRQVGAASMPQFTLVSEGAIFTFDASGQVAAFDVADLRLRWISTLRSEGCAAPVACGDHLLVLSRGGHLAMLERESGLKAWEGRIEGRFSHSPALGTIGGQLVVACASNDVGLLTFQMNPYYNPRRST